MMGIHEVGGSDHTKWVGGVSIQMQLGPCLVIIRALSGYRYWVDIVLYLDISKGGSGIAVSHISCALKSPPRFGLNRIFENKQTYIIWSLVETSGGW